MPSTGETVPIKDDFGGGDTGGQGAEGDDQTPDCRDPVDPISGQLMTAKADVELDGVLALVLRRAYASGYRHGRLYGPGWSSTLDQRLVIDADGIHFLGDDAQILNYAIPTQPGQRLLPAAGARWPLVWDRTADAIAITDPVCRPDPALRTAPRAPRQRRCRRKWQGSAPSGANHRPQRQLVVDSTGCGPRSDGNRTWHDYRIAVECTYRADGFRIEGLRLIDPAHPQGVALVGYGYDPAGRLVEIVDGGGAALVYEYDAAHRIRAWIDRVGYWYEYSYDENGRIASVGGEDGTLAARFEYDCEARCTRVIDSCQAVTEYWYDEHNHLIKTVDPVGSVTGYRQDRFGRMVEHIDPLGNTTRFVRDESGNVRELQRADGSRVLAEYNAFGQALRVTAPGGAVSALEYDERGNLTAVTDPSGAVVRYAPRRTRWTCIDHGRTGQHHRRRRESGSNT